MPSRAARASSKADSRREPEETAEENYAQLLMTIRHTQGIFALLPVRSNYSTSNRDAFLRRLETDLGDLPMRFLRLGRESRDPGPMIDEVVKGLDGRGVIVLLGLEDTPGIVPAAGEEHRRPPALAVLNHAREAIRSRCPYPLIVWCDPLTYSALREHAPDFYDYFTGLFTFEAPEQSEVKGERATELTVTSRMGISAEIPESLKAGSRSAVEFYKRRLAQMRDPTLERARSLLGLAEALWALPGGDVAARLDQAERAVSEALAIATEESAPIDWARGQSLLGRILSFKPSGNPGTILRSAIACFESALRVYTESSHPVPWADAQNRLGIAHARFRALEMRQHVDRAIACFTAALRVYTESAFPRDWAAIQNNLGNVYAFVSSIEGAGSPAWPAAIGCFESALRTYSTEGDARDWAMTQTNLGLAYAAMSMNHPDEYLRRAIACFEAALRVYSEEEAPRDRALTLRLLGNAYAILKSGDRIGHIHRAISCYDEALSILEDPADSELRNAIGEDLNRRRFQLSRLQSAPV